jgi:hypothetical protein
MKTLKTLIFILIACQVNAQSFDWGTTDVNHDLCQNSTRTPTIMRTLLKTSDGEYVRLAYNKCKTQAFPKLRLEHFDENFRNINSETIKWTKYSSTHLHTIIKGNNQFHIFYSFFNNVEKTNTLYVQTLDLNGEKVGEERIISKHEGLRGFKMGAFFIAVSEDNSHIAVLSMPAYKKKTNENFLVTVLDGNLKTVTNQEIVFDFPRKRIYYNTPFVDNNGTFYMYKSRKDKEKNRLKELYVLAAGATTFKKVNIDLGEEGLSDLYQIVNKSNGNSVLTGLTKSYNPFYMEIGTSGELLRTVIGKFEGFMPKTAGGELLLKEVIVAKNDDILFLGTIKGQETITSSNKQTTHTDFSQTNFYTARLNAEGTVWSKFISRGKLTSKNDFGIYLGAVAYYDTETDELKIIYNNLMKHYDKKAPNGNFKIPVVSTISASGEMQKKSLLNGGVGVLYIIGKDKNGRIIHLPKDTHSFSPDEAHIIDSKFIVKCANKDGYRLGVMIF